MAVAAGASLRKGAQDENRQIGNFLQLGSNFQDFIGEGQGKLFTQQEFDTALSRTDNQFVKLLQADKVRLENGFLKIDGSNGNGFTASRISGTNELSLGSGVRIRNLAGPGGSANFIVSRLPGINDPRSGVNSGLDVSTSKGAVRRIPVNNLLLAKFGEDALRSGISADKETGTSIRSNLALDTSQELGRTRAFAVFNKAPGQELQADPLIQSGQQLPLGQSAPSSSSQPSARSNIDAVRRSPRARRGFGSLLSTRTTNALLS